MPDLPFFIFREHSSQVNDNGRVLSKLISNNISEYQLSSDNLKYLGLNEKFKADYFIGMRWIEWQEEDSKQKGIIWVKPKHDDIPYEQLLWKCLDHPVVCNHLDQCYEIFPDEPAIPLMDNTKDFITPLLITDFLVRVQKIVKKGLKLGFVNVKDTLNYKIKGKILVNQTIKYQLKKSTITEIHCSYQVHTTNCIENQILKAALLQSQKYIYRFLKDRNNIKDLLHYNLAAFNEVNVTSINHSDFITINHSAFYKEYKPALHLAKLIMKGLGFSINSDISRKDKTVPPFYINMPELFERYCEVILRNQYPDTLAGYQYTGLSETRLGKSRQRPDFIIPSENRIVESKYKYWIKGSNDIGGLLQLSLYSRHEKAIEKLNNKVKRPKLQFLYPNDKGATTIKFDDEVNQGNNGVNKKIKDYPDIFKYPLSLNEY
jgi:5-methylcytosine-specific restriction enzyme subunit McrC